MQNLNKETSELNSKTAKRLHMSQTCSQLW